MFRIVYSVEVEVLYPTEGGIFYDFYEILLLLLLFLFGNKPSQLTRLPPPVHSTVTLLATGTQLTVELHRCRGSLNERPEYKGESIVRCSICGFPSRAERSPLLEAREGAGEHCDSRTLCRSICYIILSTPS